MYEVTVKGDSLQSLRKAYDDMYVVLHGNSAIATEVEKDIDKMVEVIKTVAQCPDVIENIDAVKVVEEFEEIAPSVPYSGEEEELDGEGLPWDKRIHASSKAKVKAGTWRTKKGLDKAILAQVKAELKGGMERLANPVAIPDLPISPETPVIAPIGINQPVLEAVQKVVEAAPVPVQPTVASGHSLETFKTNFPMILVDLINKKLIDQEYVNALKAHFKVEELWGADDEQKAQMFDSFAEYGFITKVG